MGLSPFKSSEGSFISPNPNPENFSIVREEVVNGLQIVMALYPECTTYGGKKVLVYENRDIYVRNMNKGRLDPHFLQNFLSPIARFPGNEAGWNLAKRFAEAL